MKKVIVMVMSALLLVLLVDVGESQGRTERFYGRGGAYDRNAGNYEHICPAPNCCRPYRHSHYMMSPGNYYRYQNSPRHYFRTTPGHRRYGLSSRGGSYGRFGRHNRYYQSGLRSYGRGNCYGRDGSYGGSRNFSRGLTYGRGRR